MLRDINDEQKKKILMAFQQLNKQQAKENINRFDDTLDRVVDKLANDGWTLPSELGIYEVNVIGQTEKIEDINEFLFTYFTRNDYEVFNKMLDGILASKIREPLKKMIYECRQAYTNKLYIVCAVALIPVIEGILSEFCDNKNNIRMMRICKNQVDALSCDGSVIEKHIWKSYNTFIQNLYEKSDFSGEEPVKINRHWILHGRSNYEQEEADCIRLFNAVQSLCMIVNKMES